MTSPSSSASEHGSHGQGHWAKNLDETEPLVLEVGNHLFKTTVATLKKIPNSYFSALLSGQYPIARQSDGSIFIDRDGKHFASILSFMRSGYLSRPKDRIERKEILLEAEYYCLREAILEAWVWTEESALPPPFPFFNSYFRFRRLMVDLHCLVTDILRNFKVEDEEDDRRGEDTGCVWESHVIFVGSLDDSFPAVTKTLAVRLCLSNTFT